MADSTHPIPPASPNSPPPDGRKQPDKVNLVEGYTASTGQIANMRLRRPLSRNTLRALARLIDSIVVCFIAYTCLRLSGETLLGASVATALPFIALPLLTAFTLKALDAYRFGYRRSAFNHMLHVANGTGLALFGFAMLVLLINGWSATGLLILAAATSWVAIIALHAHFVSAMKSLMRNGRLSENVVIVGATANARRLIARNAETRDLNIVGVFDDRLSRAPADLAGVPLLGRLDDLLAWERLPEIDRIVVTVTSEARERVRNLIDRLRILPQRVVLLLDLEGFDPETQSLAKIANSPAAYVSGAPQDERRAMVKRCSDLVFASLMLIGFSPLLIATAIAIKLDSPGPVFFRQRRHGFNNEIIRVWKFRSMRPDKAAEVRMTAQTEKNDPRVTRIGRFIRKTSIDELPQLFNVLKGEMSIVGPRPHALGMTTEETEVHDIVGDYAHRHRVKPGITGWAQINGSRGPVHTKAEVRERVRFDMEYVNRASFWFDLYIMIMTAPCLLGDAKRDR